MGLGLAVPRPAAASVREWPWAGGCSGCVAPRAPPNPAPSEGGARLDDDPYAALNLILTLTLTLALTLTRLDDDPYAAAERAEHDDEADADVDL